jgi:hypothetical protein
LKVTVSLAIVELKPKPLMTTEPALMARLPVAAVTTGMTLATGTVALLTWLPDGPTLTVAVRLPTAVGAVENV